MNTFKNIKFAWKYAKEMKWCLLLILLLNIFSVVFGIISPIYSAKIIVSLTDSEYKSILYIAIVILVIDGLYNLFHYFIRMLSMKVYRNTVYNINMELGKNILSLENSCLDNNGSGLFIQRMTSDTSCLADIFNNFLHSSAGFIKDIGVLIAIFTINKIVFLYVLINLIIMYFIEHIRVKKFNNDDKIFRKSKERVSSFISELVRGARDIKMLNSEKDFLSELSNRVEDSFDKETKLRYRSWKYKIFNWEFETIFRFTVIVLLVILMEKGLVLSTMALILYKYIDSSCYVIYSISDILDYLQNYNLSCERIRSLIDSKEFPKEVFGNKKLNKVNGDFEFKNVCFGYDKDRLVLNNINFKINANSTVAFVGSSGAGKSTIFSLLCKMYNINSGEILIDGISISQLDKDSIRGNITIISQNPYIFNMSIRDNLKIVKSDLTDDDMIESCKVACLHDFIMSLPNGYDTVVGEGGVTLSGGEKQRLAIARALVQKTEIILFDEATSALDNETQEKITKAINNMKSEYTILIIAHRLSTVLNADKIMLLDNGKIAATGTHDELLKKSKKYKSLYEDELLKGNN